MRASRPSVLPAVALAAIALLSAACGGGGGGGAAPTLAAPANLVYSANPAVFTKGIAIAADTPSSGGGPVSAYAIAPALPAGLLLNAASGVLSGTPTAVAATAAYTVTASNGGGSTTTALVLTVHDAAPTGLTYANPRAVYATGSAIAPNAPTSGGGAVVSFAVQPALPQGLSLNPTTGVISGTPTAALAAATYTVAATNSGGHVSADLVIAVVPGAPAVQIAAFSVGADETLTYPNAASDPNHLTNLADEHTTFMPNGPSSWLVFASSGLKGGSGGAVVLQTSDLKTFDWATSLGYARQVFTPPVDFQSCDPAWATVFDENYAAPGSVVQDPTLPPGNLMMFYEAENHCPGGTTNQQPFYGTVGFARSSDFGKTWPAPVDGVLGGPARHPVLKGPNPQPDAPGYPGMGNAIPSAFVDINPLGDAYAYVVYGYYAGGYTPAGDSQIRVARARLGADPLVFQKWYNGAFSQPGIGGLDATPLPGPGCPSGKQRQGSITYNDDLGLYLMLYVCTWGPAGSETGAWYYSTATSLDLQNWSQPQMIANSQFAVVQPCPGKSDGAEFDGFYPSIMSPGAATNHTRLTGKIFFINGCDTGSRTFTARSFTITVAP